MSCLPISFLSTGLHLLRWLGGFGWVSIIWRQYPISQILYLYPSGLEEYTGMGAMMRDGLNTGSRFLLMKDEVTDVLYIRLATGPFLLVSLKLSKFFELKLQKYCRSSWAYPTLSQQFTPLSLMEMVILELHHL
ncbi:hypothetical protein HOY80DRAFT_130292 [Tuber brumale]|nr:hypothetical protein HOY80DRAFT_130292 [Tuber brumale]